MKHLILALFAWLVTIYPASCQNPEKQFDEILNGKSFEESPGLAVLVAKNDKVIYRKAFGYANLELDVKLKPEHIFRIGSITKQFTACAILKLAEEGKLSLQDEITKFIKDYPAHGHTITIEHLLTHTSGIKSYTGMKEWTEEVRRKDFKVEELIDFFKKEPMDFAPGEKYSYNNSAYFLLGYIIEIVSEKTYEDYLNETFFKPLGLENTSYDNTSRTIKNRVAGYQKNGDVFENADYLSMTQPYSAGSLISNVDDLYKWYTAVMNDQVVSAPSREKAHSSYVLTDGKATGYGYGWGLGKIQGTPMIQHGGGINGFLTASLYLPEEKVFVAVFSNCNCNPPGTTAFKLAAAAIGKPFKQEEIALKKDKLSEYTGVFESENNGRRTLIMTADSLMFVMPSGSRERLIPYATDRFFIKDNLTDFVFSRDTRGNIESLTANSTGYLPQTWNKTNKSIELKKEMELPEELLEKYVGKYELFPDFILTVTRQGTRVFLQATGQDRSEIFASEPNRFFSKTVNAEIIFNLNGNGKVTGLTLLQNGEHKADKIE